MVGDECSSCAEFLPLVVLRLNESIYANKTELHVHVYLGNPLREMSTPSSSSGRLVKGMEYERGQTRPER